jgi:hypothetical protein
MTQLNKYDEAATSIATTMWITLQENRELFDSLINKINKPFDKKNCSGEEGIFLRLMINHFLFFANFYEALLHGEGIKSDTFNENMRWIVSSIDKIHELGLVRKSN